MRQIEPIPEKTEIVVYEAEENLGGGNLSVVKDLRKHTIHK